MRPDRRGRPAALLCSVAVVALVSAGCSSGGAPATVGVPRGGFANDKADPATAHWFKAHLSVISALGGLPNIPTSQPNYSALSAACISFGEAVTTAKALPPIPNDGAQTLWRDALSEFSAGVTNCANGVGHMSAILLSDASKDFSLGHTTLATLVFGPPSKSGANGA